MTKVSNEEIYREIVNLKTVVAGDGTKEKTKSSIQHRLINVESKIDRMCKVNPGLKRRASDNGNKMNVGQFIRSYKWLMTILLTTFTLLIVGWMAANINWEGVNMLIDTANKLKPSQVLKN